MNPRSKRIVFNLVLLVAMVLVAVQFSLVLAEPAAPADPGGIGTAHLTAWFDAGVGTFSDTDCITDSISGGLVACWKDQGDNGLQVVQNAPSKRPTWQTNQLNFLPVVRFDGGSDYLASSIDPLNVAFPMADTTIFVVQKTSVAQQGSTFSAAPVDLNNRFNATIPSNDNTVYWQMGNVNAGGNGELTYSPFSDTSSFYLWGFGMDSGLGKTIYQNGESKASDSTADAFNPSGKSFYLGSADNNDDFFDGDIAELIIYNNVLSDTNRTHVELYLRDKYNLDLSDAGLYTAPAAYQHNVRGLSMSAGVLNSDLPSSLTAGLRALWDSFPQDADDVLVFGHNNADFALVEDGLTISAANRRWARLWSFDVQDALPTLFGRVYLKFDISDAGGTGTFASDGSYYLLKRATGSNDNFTDVTPVSAPVISGDEIQFQVNISDLGSEFTLGSANDAPLATGLESFSAGELNASSVLLVALVGLLFMSLTILLRRKKEMK